MTTIDVKVCEMSLRDGLQYLGGPDAAAAGRLVPVPSRLRLLDALVASGVRHIEAGAFVSPRGTPQMAASDELGRLVDPSGTPGLELSALVPNDRGYERFAATRFNVVATFPSANEVHCRTNFGGRGVDEVLAMAGEVARRARADGYRLRAHVSAAFQDIAAATVASDLDTVVRVSRTVLLEHGCEYLTLADTNGTTSPHRIHEVLEAVGAAIGDLTRIGVHLHDHLGTGIANAYAAWEKGVRIFDASLGGLGGSVAASRAAGGDGSNMVGNIATESLVALLHGLGARTGIDLEHLMKVAGGELRTILEVAGGTSEGRRGGPV
jgi:hydroxymethylglutaryl-CoA lyase